jgi:uncharacterized protein YlxW (UPF0749 family)
MSDDPRESPDAVPDPPADAPAPAAGGAAPGDGEEPGTSDVREPATPDGEDVAAAGPGWRGGRRDRKAAATIGVLTLLLGFAFAVQVRNTGTDEALVSAREQDLVVLLDNQTAAEDRLRQEIADQQAVLDQLGNTDNQAAAALEDARERAEALDVLNGSIAATGPGLELTIRDPEGRVEPATVLNAVQELRGAGAETMQVDDVRVGVSTAVTGDAGAIEVDGRPVTAPYTFLVIGSPQDLETAMSIPGGVIAKVRQRGGTVSIVQSEEVLVDALRPLDAPEYARPQTDD